MRRGLFCVSALCAVLLVVGIAAASAGSLRYGGCFANSARFGCQSLPGQPLSGTDGGIAVSPDGGSVYATVYGSGTVLSFARDSTGALTYEGCFADHGRHGCQPPANSSLAHPEYVAVSPDGTSVYVVSANDRESALSIFNRASDGTLTYSGCFADLGTYGCQAATHNSLVDLSGVAFSPDGGSVYVAGGLDANAITTFLRAPDGSLSYTGCIASNYFGTKRIRACAKTPHQSLQDPRRLAISADGRSLYVGSFEEPVLTELDRAPDGVLTYGGCFADRAKYGCQATRHDSLGSDDGVTVSPDGNSVYTASLDNSALTRFARAPDGALTVKGCFSSGGLDAARGCRKAPYGSLEEGISVAVSPDGQAVYYGGLSGPGVDGGPGSLAVFDRTANGSLTYQSCYVSDGRRSCRRLPHLAVVDFEGLALSADGSSLYASSDDSVGRFDRLP
jgi:DNA-binding beta-propeller fold protein YncE